MMQLESSDVGLWMALLWLISQDEEKLEKFEKYYNGTKTEE